MCARVMIGKHLKLVLKGSVCAWMPLIACSTQLHAQCAIKRFVCQEQILALKIHLLMVKALLIWIKNIDIFSYDRYMKCTFPQL